ncbi:hypothetical protein OO006_11365 [Prosthecochloris sp. SCSIO W1101]|uniref:hypothetical protein n=1 Tax=Prosthecochloris sp. SCSIO W1101 TaxID=2992242 RepID=UPI00223CCF4C|nr:hypothetical protein [Prosthecochloris sp. SCSIO W1101]UZJ40940.1 hypothetical protein OO006_11365 [Prosthecochloris sp. SCSIO W1101]
MTGREGRHAALDAASMRETEKPMDPRVEPYDDGERNVMPDMMWCPWRETSEPMDPRIALRLPEDDWKRDVMPHSMRHPC